MGTVWLHNPNRQKGTRWGRIIPTVTFRFNLGFQLLLEKPITSRMQKYRTGKGEERDILYDLLVGVL